MFNDGVTYSGVMIYGPSVPVGLNPSIKICEASSTYLLIKKWSKSIDAEGKLFPNWTSIEPVWDTLSLSVSPTSYIFLTTNVLFSLPSNLNSSPYFTDQGNDIGLNPEPEISTW